MIDKIARPYSAAAFGYAKANDLLGEWGKIFSALQESEDSICAAVRANPGGELELAAVLSEAMKVQESPFGNFLMIVAESRRMACLGAIARQFSELHMNAEGVAAIRVETAFEMGFNARRNFDKALAKWSGKKRVRVVYEENSHLLGGVRIYIKDNVLDASVRGRLERLAAALG
ncbi:MAG: ATP synthase F1 subunit delta [Gammaproteobacteria bacterium WSBS_2016_MAG_OTU1]